MWWWWYTLAHYQPPRRQYLYASLTIAPLIIDLLYGRYHSNVWAWKSGLFCRVDFAKGSDKILDSTRREGVSQNFRPISRYIGAVITVARLTASRHLLTMSGESPNTPHSRSDHEIATEWEFRPAATDCLLSATLNPRRIHRDRAKITPRGRVVDSCGILHNGYSSRRGSR